MHEESSARLDPRTENLLGKPFERLTVIAFAGYQFKGTKRVACWFCICLCGNHLICQGSNLKNGHSRSCGCLKKKIARTRTHDLNGQLFGRLTVLTFAGHGHRGRAFWTCECSCGTIVICQASNLKNGTTNSCGCYKKDRIRETNATHGLRRSFEYGVWAGMLRRCYNPNEKSFPRYGGRGITVCDRWRSSFENFHTDIGPRPSNLHSLERRNNALGYNPENCLWVTNQEQQRNKRSNHLLTFDNRTQCLAAWAEERNIKQHTLLGRLHRKWPIERALMTPVIKYNH